MYYKLIFFLFLILNNAFTSVDKRRETIKTKKDLSKTLNNIKDPLPIEYIVEEKFITLTVDDVMWRYNNRSYPFIADPVKLKILAKDFKDLSKKIAKPKFAEKLEALLFDLDEIKKDKNFYYFTLSKEMIPIVKETLLKNYFRTKTYDLFINIDEINISNINNVLNFYGIKDMDKDHFKKQILFLKSKDRKIINVKELFFPKFAKKNYNKFSHFHGPNCFHAALSFNRFGIEYDRKINYKIEKNLNFNFINNYEFFNALKNNYQKIDLEKENISFGDIIVFYEKSISNDGSIFKSYKHGSAYIGNGFAYTKGSKRGKHPYKLVKVFDDYKHWEKLIGDVGIHIYRKKIDKY